MMEGATSSIKWLESHSALITILISSVALGIVVFTQFVQGPRLTTQLTQINLMRLAGSNQSALLIEMLVDDLLSDDPSASARAVIAAHPQAAPQQGIQDQDKEQLRLALQDSARGDKLAYAPSPSRIEQYFGSLLLSPSFYVPLLVTNSGAKSGHISSLVLVAASTVDPNAKWAFSAFTEVNVSVLLDKSRPHADSERIKTIFNGLAIPAHGSAHVDALFIPQHDASKTIISTRNLPPGSYRWTVFGYSAEGRVLVRTKPIDHTVTAEALVEMFRGNDAVNFLVLEEHITDALRR